MVSPVSSSVPSSVSSSSSVSSFAPSFVVLPSFLDSGMYSFEGFDDFSEKLIKGKKYRRKTHPVELFKDVVLKIDVDYVF